MKKFITSIPAKSITDEFTSTLNASLVPLENYRISLTDEEKIGMRSMAEGREGYVRLISRIATQFPNALSRADQPEELENKVDLYDRLEGNRLAALQVLEVIQELQLGVATVSMTLVDRYAANLKISRSNEAALDLAMRDVDAYNTRFANKPENPDTPEVK